MTDASSAQSIGRQWWDAWTGRASTEEKRSLLADEVVFRFNTAPEKRGVDAFLSGETWPSGFTATLLAEVPQGQRVVHLYDVVNGSARMRVAELLSVGDGRITAIDFIVDTAAYPAFLAGDAPQP
ncbi:MAG: hypothetical protein AAFY28_11845 [Actinomycetota bacterium]